jgi:hypothetical protein
MTAWSEGNVQANGINIHYYRTGDNNKPSILLLHGVMVILAPPERISRSRCWLMMRQRSFEHWVWKSPMCGDIRWGLSLQRWLLQTILT